MLNSGTQDATFPNQTSFMKVIVLCMFLSLLAVNSIIAQNSPTETIQDEPTEYSQEKQVSNEAKQDGRLISGGTDFSVLYAPKDKKYGFSIGTQLNKFFYTSSTAAVYCHEEENLREITIGLGYGNHANFENGLMIQGSLVPYIGNIVGDDYNFTKVSVSAKQKSEFTYGISLNFGIGIRIYQGKKEQGDTYITLGYSTRAQKFKMNTIGDYSAISIGFSQNIGETNIHENNIYDDKKGEIHPYIIYDEVSRIYNKTLPHLYGFASGIGTRLYIDDECYISTGLTYLHTSSRESTITPLKEPYYTASEYKLNSLRMPIHVNILAKLGYEKALSFGIGCYVDHVLDGKIVENRKKTKLSKMDGYNRITAGFSTSLELMLTKHWDIHGKYSHCFIEQLEEAKEEQWSFGIGYTF